MKNLQINAATTGDYLMGQLAQFDGVVEVRGLMIGAEFDFPTGNLRKKLLFEERVFVGSASNPKVIRLLPPFRKVIAIFTAIQLFLRQRILLA